jgi:hypothetical protein
MEFSIRVVEDRSSPPHLDTLMEGSYIIMVLSPLRTTPSIPIIATGNPASTAKFTKQESNGKQDRSCGIFSQEIVGHT